MTLLVRRHRQLPHRPRSGRRRGRGPTYWRVATDERRTADEWAVLLKGLLRESTVSEHVRGLAVCSTVPSALHEWRQMMEDPYHGAVPHVVVEPGVRTGVPVLMDNPREVGARTASSTRSRPPSSTDGPSIVVDFGTATTFDVVSPRVSTSAARSHRVSTSPRRPSAAAAPSCARSSCSGQASR